MSAYWPTLLLSALYLLLVYAGPHLMRRTTRQFSLRAPLLAYNLALICLNLYIAVELLSASRARQYSYVCQPVDYSDDPDELRIASALWWFYASKLIEFCDTFFFVLRRKHAQISYLHVYHHATMFPIWWVGVRWVAGGQSFFGALLNSSIHVLMYGYYALAGLGPRAAPYLGWKRHLTRLQLCQFVAGMTHAGIGLALDCEFPRWMHWALIGYAGSIMLFFLNFYKQAYRRLTSTTERAPHAKTTKSIMTTETSEPTQQRQCYANGDQIDTQQQQYLRFRHANGVQSGNSNNNKNNEQKGNGTVFSSGRFANGNAHFKQQNGHARSKKVE